MCRGRVVEKPEGHLFYTSVDIYAFALCIYMGCIMCLFLVSELHCSFCMFYRFHLGPQDQCGATFSLNAFGRCYVINFIAAPTRQPFSCYHNHVRQCALLEVAFEESTPTVWKLTVNTHMICSEMVLEGPRSSFRKTTCLRSWERT